MDKLFSLIESKQKGMGSISIFEKGEEMYQNSFGYASIEENIKAINKTKYRIGSISKTFTAAIIMSLIENGKLSLTAPLADFFPEIKNSSNITIAHLLKHRSGIFNFTSSEDYPSWMEQSISKEELVKRIVANGSSFEPNEKFEYSNSNYVLLSFIAEKIENKEYEEIIKETICKPCSLVNTYYGSDIIVKNNEAKSYTNTSDWKLATETDMSVPVGAGAIVSNPTELNQFLNCLFDYKIVSEQAVNSMIKIEDGYGMGIFQAPFYDKKAYGHNGGIDGFQSNAFYFPEEKVSVAYTSNGVVMPMNDILIGALSIYFGKEYALPEFNPPLDLKPEELDTYLGIYSSPDFPLKITISKEKNKLIGQATGQSSFPLEAYEPSKFKFDQAGLKMEFKPDDNKMILRQGGGEFELKKE
ncbi:serine hydrolase domain-containing protein [Eudoraea sp.]